MTAFDYSGLADTAAELLDEFGMSMTLARASGSAPTYDTATGVATPVSPASYTVTGAKFDYAAREIDGTLIQAGDLRVLLSTIGAVMPMPGDTLTIGTAAYQVINASAIAPAEVDILYDVQVRK